MKDLCTDDFFSLTKTNEQENSNHHKSQNKNTEVYGLLFTTCLFYKEFIE